MSACPAAHDIISVLGAMLAWFHGALDSPKQQDWLAKPLGEGTHAHTDGQHNETHTH
jgi:hypothetical protein